MRLLRRPMAENDFWKLIAVMNGDVDEDAVARLTEALSARRHRDVVAFQERLALALFELDRRELARQPVRFTDDPPDEDPIPLGDDMFLYLRAGIVARGRAVWQAVLAEPSLLAAGTWDECEHLLYVADEVTGDELDTKVSYETGSNERYWPAPDEPEREPWDQGHRLVYVDCRDLADPIHGEKFHEDGSTEPFVSYLPPKYISWDLIEELVLRFSKVVTLNGGLPAEVGAVQLAVTIDFGDEHQLDPVVGEPAEDDEYDVGLVRPVHVTVNAEEARHWTTDRQRSQLSALTASCVLAALPEQHPARPELTRIADDFSSAGKVLKSRLRQERVR
ncbi:DUF4240 domain-containing protein [Dactylosporangium cerinum]|uniref:DUF4240 domain-containing protein n=1 Tax=Dactylosporangium cerinum TaxID=1434730 RepID=A0ABV9WJZ0_9ACTN